MIPMEYRQQILGLPLNEVLRPEIALPLQHVLQIYTVGSFLKAWENGHPQIASLFDSVEQAHEVASLCATWAGWRISALPATASSSWMLPD